MTADELIAEAAANRIERKRTDVRKVLHLLLTAILETIDYEQERETLIGQVARMIACAIVAIDDNRRMSS
ncbi:MAG TPA: hypothetical protein VF339_18585 [Gammaproteobacteria bacterium]